MAKGTFIFRQLFDNKSCTYTYLLADHLSKNGLLIDPVIEKVDRDLQLINQLGIKLKYVINTHLHADHISGSGKIKQKLDNVKSIISRASEAQADILVEEGDEIKCGEIKLDVKATPGHTNGCISLVNESESCVFTGDALLIRSCGRTDFQEGSANQLYDSVYSKLFTLPDSYLVYPAHDYNGFSCTTIGEEKKYNVRLIKPKEEFIKLMNNLNLDYPKMMDIAVPKNRKCGI